MSRELRGQSVGAPAGPLSRSVSAINKFGEFCVGTVGRFVSELFWLAL